VHRDSNIKQKHVGKSHEEEASGKLKGVSKQDDYQQGELENVNDNHYVINRSII
jgi:hypothetical protein